MKIDNLNQFTTSLKRNLFWERLSFFLVISLLFFTACQKSPIREQNGSSTTDTSFTSGVFVVNEGNFNWGNASVTFIDPVNNKVYQDIFKARNGRSLGDVAESMSLANNQGYIVVNNSNDVEVVSATNFSSIKTIKGFNEPRDIMFYKDKKAYVTNLLKNISVIDLNTLSIINNIPTPDWTEGMVAYDQYLFTTCIGNYNLPNAQRNPRVLVINMDKDIIVDSIKTGKEPVGIVKDKKNKLWVLCTGGYDNVEAPRLMRIDAELRVVEKVIPFPSSSGSPSRLVINPTADTLYFLYNGVFRMPVTSDAIPSQAFIPSNGRNFYGLGIDPSTGNIYVSDAVDYVQNGVVYQYNQNDGNLIHSFTAGRIPGSFCFTTSTQGK